MGGREEWSGRNRPQRLLDGALRALDAPHVSCSDLELLTHCDPQTTVSVVNPLYFNWYIVVFRILPFHIDCMRLMI